VAAADHRPAGPLVALAGVIRGLGADGAVRNAARALDERHRRLTDLEGRLAGTSDRPVVPEWPETTALT